MSGTATTAPFDPLDMRNYSLEKFKDIKAGVWMNRFKLIGVPLAIFFFLFFHMQWCGPITAFEERESILAKAKAEEEYKAPKPAPAAKPSDAAAKAPDATVKPAEGAAKPAEAKPAPAPKPAKKLLPLSYCYTALGIFVASLILWLSEAIPNYLTSMIVICAAILTGVMKMRPAFAMMGEPVMILNIASFIMASGLVVTGLAKRLCLYLVLRMGHKLSLVFWAFIILNLILGAFISATSAKTALLLPLFMVISAIYGATGGENRNGVGRNMVLLNLLANNVSASAFITGSAANLWAANALENAGAKVYYGDWFIALFPLAVIQCGIAWWTGTRLIFPIKKEDAIPKIAGGLERLRKEFEALGKISTAEIRAAIIFLIVLALWATDMVHGIRAEVVAVMGACAALMPAFSKLPRIGVMKWNDADIPWHMLMFSFGAYVLGGLMDETDIVGLFVHRAFDNWNIHPDSGGKLLVFAVMSAVFGITTLVSESKTARTIIMFPIIISIARQFNWDIIGFALPMGFMINQVYVLYFNSKPANISYLTDQYSTWESFKYGMTQLIIIWVLLIPWTHYVMPLMGFKSQLW